MTEKLSHQFLGECVGFGADPTCMHCHRYYSEISKNDDWYCKEHTEYMELMEKISKRVKAKRKLEQLKKENPRLAEIDRLCIFSSFERDWLLEKIGIE